MYTRIYSAQLGLYRLYIILMIMAHNSPDPIEWDGLTADFLCKAWVGQAWLMAEKRIVYIIYILYMILYDYRFSLVVR
jgi:hypothetical protein